MAFDSTFSKLWLSSVFCYNGSASPSTSSSSSGPPDTTCEDFDFDKWCEAQIPEFGNPDVCCCPCPSGCSTEKCGCNKKPGPKKEESAEDECADEPCKWKVCKKGCEPKFNDVSTARSPLQRAAQKLRIWSKPKDSNGGNGECSAGEGCGTCCRPARVRMPSGDLSLQIDLPEADAFAPSPVLTYHSSSGRPGSMAFNWRCKYEQEVQEIDSTTVDVVKGSGKVRRYTDPDADGIYTPPGGANNSLVKNADGTWTETQTDGFELRYDAAGQLSKLQSKAGDVWTLTYNADDQLSHITDPLKRRTSFVYGAGSYIRRIADTAGRITTFTVSADGDLTKVTTPEMCVVEMRYDQVGRVMAYVASDGLRTSYSHDDLDRVTEVQAPSGARTTYAYQSGATVITNPPWSQDDADPRGRRKGALADDSPGRAYDLHLVRRTSGRRGRSAGQSGHRHLCHHEQEGSAAPRDSAARWGTLHLCSGRRGQGEGGGR